MVSPSSAVGVDEFSGAELPEAEQVLRACLDYLPLIHTSDQGRLEVVDAWVEGPSVVCVVYRHEFAPDEVIGHCRDFLPYSEPGGPQDSGEALAEEIYEPLGAVGLREDPATGISWVGLVPPAPFPVRPGLAERL